MKVLHTSDWHVGRSIRGRSRAEEHVAVLAEIGSIARQEGVDLVVVAGDLFDTATPSAESERIVFRALLDLAGTGASVVVVAGNHDSAHRLQAVRPLLELGRVEARAVGAGPAAGGVIAIRSRDGCEPAKVAVLPFLSQRHVVRATDLMSLDAGDHGHLYDQRVRQWLAVLTEGFGPETVNLVVAHLSVTGGLLGGGERPAHTLEQYQVAAAGFPASAQYVALGHLHRRQRMAGACPIHYCGSPLQLDFGETSDVKSVLVIDVAPGVPAAVAEHRLSAGRRLRTLVGSLDDLAPHVGRTGTDHLRITVLEAPRPGLGDDVRSLFPDCVDVRVVRPDGGTAAEATAAGRSGLGPTELFGQYLQERGAASDELVALFAEVLEEVS
ncbi:MAG: exonuclease subunit SbcD [Acidimicrobiales bacterium]